MSAVASTVGTTASAPLGERTGFEVVLPTESALTARANDLLAAIESITITDAVTYQLATDELSRMKLALAEVEREEKGWTKPLTEYVARIRQRFAAPKATMERGIELMNGKVITYQAEVEAKRKAEQKRLDDAAAAERARIAQQAAEAQRKAEADAAAIRAKAEADAAEIRRKADADAAAAKKKAALEAERLKAEGDAKAAKEAKERAAREAKERAEAVARAEVEAKAKAEAEAKAREEAAAAETMRAAIRVAEVYASVAKVETPTAKGQAIVGTWKGRVKDKHALIGHVAANPQLAYLLDVNEQKLNSDARNQESALAYPGVEPYLDQHTRTTKR